MKPVAAAHVIFLQVLKVVQHLCPLQGRTEAVQPHTWRNLRMYQRRQVSCVDQFMMLLPMRTCLPHPGGLHASDCIYSFLIRYLAGLT